MSENAVLAPFTESNSAFTIGYVYSSTADIVLVHRFTCYSSWFKSETI